MSRTALLGLMALIEGGAGLLLLVSPGAFRRMLLGNALPGLPQSGVQVAGLVLLGLGLMCLLGWRRGGSRHLFGVMLAYNSLAAAGLAGIGLLAGTVGPLLWPAVLLHGALAAMQLRARRAP